MTQRAWFAATGVLLTLSGCVLVTEMDAERRTVTVVYSEERPRLDVMPTGAVRDKADRACVAFDSGSEAAVLLNAERVAADRVRYVFFCPPRERRPAGGPPPGVRT